MKSVENRFWEKVDKSGDCWLWTATKTNCGYGSFKLNGKMQSAHRVVIELEGSDIPSGMCVLHHCDVRACVNPDHLYIGTHQKNTADMFERGRHVVPKGEAHYKSKLTDYNIRYIRAACKNETQAKVGSWFGISQGHVSRIVRRKKWRHI